MELFNLKGNDKRKNIFRESILLYCLKISKKKKKNCTTVCLEIIFSTKSFHLETSQLIALQIN